MRIQHWQDVASLLLGVWLILSPFALGFAGAATWIAIVLGLCVILFAVEGFVIPSYLEEWGEVLLGLALLAAPWAIGYESVSATVSSVVSEIRWIATIVLIGQGVLHARRQDAGGAPKSSRLRMPLPAARKVMALGAKLERSVQRRSDLGNQIAALVSARSPKC